MSTSSEIDLETVIKEVWRGFPTWLDRIQVDGSELIPGVGFYVEAHVDDDYDKTLEFVVEIRDVSYFDESVFRTEDEDD